MISCINELGTMFVPAISFSLLINLNVRKFCLISMAISMEVFQFLHFYKYKFLLILFVLGKFEIVNIYVIHLEKSCY